MNKNEKTNLVTARIPRSKLCQYVDRFFDPDKYSIDDIPERLIISSLGKSLCLDPKGLSTVTLEVEPNEDDPPETPNEFVTQRIGTEDAQFLYEHAISMIKPPEQYPAFTGADFNF